jgi:hypothetical protein
MGAHPLNGLKAVSGVATCRAGGLWPFHTVLATPRRTSLARWNGERRARVHGGKIRPLLKGVVIIELGWKLHSQSFCNLNLRQAPFHLRCGPQVLFHPAGQRQPPATRMDGGDERDFKATSIFSPDLNFPWPANYCSLIFTSPGLQFPSLFSLDLSLPRQPVPLIIFPSFELPWPLVALIIFH